MKKLKTNCKSIRARIANALAERLDLDNGWLAVHVASCPRCRKRFGNIARVDLAFTLLRSQPHTTGLFTRANTKAVNSLKHSLRNTPKAEKLKNFQPSPNWFQRNTGLLSSVTNVAACLAVLFLLKTGIFTSINKFNEKGKESLHNYYSKRLDKSICDEIFKA